MNLFKNFIPAGVCLLAAVFLLVFPASLYLVAVSLLVIAFVLALRGAQLTQRELEKAQDKTTELNLSPGPKQGPSTLKESSRKIRKLENRCSTE